MFNNNTYNNQRDLRQSDDNRYSHPQRHPSSRQIQPQIQPQRQQPQRQPQIQQRQQPQIQPQIQPQMQPRQNQYSHTHQQPLYPQYEERCVLNNNPQNTLPINIDAPREYTRDVRTEPMQFLEDDTAPMTYPDVYAPREFLQTPQMNLISNPSWFLSIDSSDRDRGKYPNPFKYTIHMTGTSDNENVTGHVFKNVYSIELISAILPNVSEIKDEMYIVLEIEELEDIGFDSSNQHLKGAYAKLVMQSHLNDNFLVLDGDNSRPLKRIYYPSPKASIDRLTITLKKLNGELIDLGPDSDPDEPPLRDIQNSFTFRIITKIPDAAPLGHRNI
jgi:hypothetical protein